MNGSLKRKVLSGLVWTYLERIMAQLVSVIVTIVLARVLSPTEYGTIAIVTIFTELANVIVVNGFGTALIQKQTPTSKDYSTIFFTNMAITCFLYWLLFIFAPVIASLYNIPELTLILRVLGLQMPIAGISSIQQAYISKKMEFKKFFFSTIIGTVISAAVGIALAYNGFGVWALVAQLLTNRSIDTLVLSFTSGWKLTSEFSLDELKKLVSYSWKISASSFLITLWDNIRGLVVGKKYTTADLAYYDKGRQFPHLVASNINTSITKVLFPALSSEQDNKGKILSMTRRAIKEGAYLLTPLLFGLAACGESFVMVLLTERWRAVIPYLQIMCIVYALQPMQTASIQAMKALGRGDAYLRLEIIKKIANFAILFISLFAFNNVIAVAVGALVSELISTLLNVPVNKKLFGYHYREQFEDIKATMLLSVAVFIIVWYIGKIIDSSYIALVVQILTGGAIYVMLSIVLKVDSFYYTRSIIMELFGKRKHKKQTS